MSKIWRRKVAKWPDIRSSRGVGRGASPGRAPPPSPRACQCCRLWLFSTSVFRPGLCLCCAAGGHVQAAESADKRRPHLAPHAQETLHRWRALLVSEVSAKATLRRPHLRQSPGWSPQEPEERHRRRVLHRVVGAFQGRDPAASLLPRWRVWRTYPGQTGFSLARAELVLSTFLGEVYRTTRSTQRGMSEKQLCTVQLVVPVWFFC